MNAGYREIRNRAIVTRSVYSCRLSPTRLKTGVDGLVVDDLSPSIVSIFWPTWNRLEVALSPRGIRGLLHFTPSPGSQASRAQSMWIGVHRFVTFPLNERGEIRSRTWKKNEIDELLRAPHRATEHGRRDFALLLFLYNSGARATEAARILIEDLTWDATGTGSARIHGKGRRFGSARSGKRQ